MTLSASASLSVSALSAERVVASGHCPVCAVFGRTVLAAEGCARCTTHAARLALLNAAVAVGR